MPTTTTRRTCGLLALLLAATASAVSAQEHPNFERGLSAATAYQSGDVDTVNLFNGNLHLTVPIGRAYPLGGGLSYGFALHYNSNVWDFEDGPLSGGLPTVAANPEPFAGAGLGWIFGLGRLYAPSTPPWNDSSSWLLLEPDGTRRTFFDKLHPDDAAAAGYRWSRDGSYLRMKDLTAAEKQVESPDGTLRIFRSDGKLRRISDPFGNWVDVTYPSATVQQLSDQHGRSQTVNLVATAGACNGQVASVVLDGFGAATSTYTFTCTPTSIERHRKDTAPNSTTVSVPLLTAVTQPDGSAWSFQYYTTNAPVDGLAQPPGAVSRVTLPTLGRYDFVYGPYGFYLDPGACQQAPCLPQWIFDGDGLRSKKVYTAAGAALGTWSYKQSGTISAVRSETVVTSPLGDETRHFFRLAPYEWQHGLPFDPGQSDASGSRHLSQEVFQGTVAAGTRKRRVYVRYATDKPTGLESNQRLASQRTLYDDDGGVYADVNLSKFDGLGHYRQVDTAGTFNAGNVRSEFTNFNPLRGVYDYDPVAGAYVAGSHSFTMPPNGDRWVLGTYDDRSVTEGGQTLKSQYCWEKTASPIAGPTGFLTRVRTLQGANPGGYDRLAVFTRTAGGDLMREQYYGGDTQFVATTAAVCSVALPSSDRYRLTHGWQYGVLKTSEVQTSTGGSIGVKPVDRDVDSSGLVAVDRDVAGLATSYEYDGLGRVTWEKPASGHDAWREHVYTRATSSSALANLTVRRRANGSKTGAIRTQDKLFFDAFGRLWKEQHLMPNGSWTTRERTYNANGWPASLSAWGATAKTTTYTGYDPFGRPTTITPPDGSSHKLTLGYAGDREVSRQSKVWTTPTQETAVFTTERYDRQGRLYQFIEASGINGAYVTTTYGYNAAGRLKSVSTPASVTTASGTQTVTQTRTFTYDGRGFLSSEKHPEKGAAGNGTVTYVNYDAAGLPGRAIDGPSDLTLTYDRAGRLTQIANTSGGALLAAWAYATGNGTGDWRQGKLQTADRYNYIAVGTTPFTVQVRESYVYGGKGGRVSARTTSWANATTGDAFTQGWTYDDLGAVTTLTYPRCTHAGCTGAAASSRSATFTYGNGSLTAAASTTAPTMGSNALGYHANGSVASLAHANGVTWSQSADPNGMARPAAYQATLGATPLWTTGAYLYDASGNVRAIGASSFVYDPVSRLASTSLITSATGGGTAKTQSFTYDAFGNLKNVAGTVGRSIPVDAASNRLTTAGAGPTCESTEVWYDAAGNLLCWHGNAYTYDGLGAVTRTLVSGVEYDHVYTAGGERLLTYQPGVGYRWTLRDLDGRVLREFKNNAGTWSVERDYLYRNGVLLAAKQPGGEVYHLHPDHLGTPRLATGNGGAQRAFHAYYPFGEEATGINQDGERMKFTGHERDLGQTASAADDLDYMHARYANPQLGRFLSVDPVHGTPYAPQTWNRYSYVANRPLVFVDPRGLSGEDCPECQGTFNETIDVVDDHWTIPTGLLNFLFGNPIGGGGGGGGGGAPPAPPPPKTTTWDSVSDTRIKTLHPCLQQKATDLVNEAEAQLGLTLRVSQATRTLAEQSALYDEGRTTPGSIRTWAPAGKSYHNFGLAFDMAPISGGKLDWNVNWTDIGILGEGLGLDWGGRWKKPKTDLPHFELPLGHTTDQLLALTASQLENLPCN